MENVFKEIVAGGIGGVAGILVTQPIDTIRIRLQSGRLPADHGVLATSKQILRLEGWRGFFKGVASPVITCGMMNAGLFLTYSNAQQYLKTLSIGNRYTEESQRVVRASIAGFLAGLPAALFNSPTELVKCRAQMSITNKGKIKEELKIAQEVMAKGSLAKGLTVTMLRDCPSYAIYFAAYEYITLKCDHAEGFQMPLTRTTVSFVAGGCAGMVAWAIVYPFDVIKTHIQIADFQDRRGITMVARGIYRAKGLDGFLGGFKATMIKAWPQNAVVFLVYESTREFLGN